MANNTTTAEASLIIKRHLESFYTLFDVGLLNLKAIQFYFIKLAAHF